VTSQFTCNTFLQGVRKPTSFNGELSKWRISPWFF